MTNDKVTSVEFRASIYVTGIKKRCRKTERHSFTWKTFVYDPEYINNNINELTKEAVGYANSQMKEWSSGTIWFNRIVNPVTPNGREFPTLVLIEKGEKTMTNDKVTSIEFRASIYVTGIKKRCRKTERHSFTWKTFVYDPEYINNNIDELTKEAVEYANSQMKEWSSGMIWFNRVVNSVTPDGIEFTTCELFSDLNLKFPINRA